MAAQRYEQSATPDYSRDASMRKGGREVTTMSTDPNLRNRNYAVIIVQEQDLFGAPENIIVGAVPDTLEISQNVNYTAPYGAGLFGNGAMGDAVSLVTGNRLVGQVMTMQVWQGSGSDFDFTLTFELRAWSDPERDVMAPLRALLKMTLPTVDDTGFLQSPGPVLSKEGAEKVAGQITSTVVDAFNAGSQGFSQGQTSDGASSVFASVRNATSAVYDTVKKSGIVKKDMIERHLKNKINIQVGRWFYMRNVVVTNVQHSFKAQTPEAETGIIQAASVSMTFRPMFAITAEDVKDILMSGNTALNLS